MRAMSVLGNAKSNRHRKTHRVEPGGTGRKFMHLTRGGLACESVRGVSRGRGSEEGRESGWSKGPKNPRRQSTEGTLKGDLGLRPVFHQLDKRIEAHVFISFLVCRLHVTLEQYNKKAARKQQPA